MAYAPPHGPAQPKPRLHLAEHSLPELGPTPKNPLISPILGFLLEHNTDAKRMERLRALVAEGAFSPTVDSIFPVKDAGEAFARQQTSGKRGKILLDFRDI